jgi:hypothetical protein
MPNSSAFEDGIATEKIKRHKAPGVDQIPACFIKTEGRKIRSEIHELINSIWNKKGLSEE